MILDNGYGTCNDNVGSSSSTVGRVVSTVTCEGNRSPEKPYFSTALPYSSTTAVAVAVAVNCNPP